MNAKSCTIEVDAQTVDMWEARAADEAGLPADFAARSALGSGAWTPNVLDEDAKRLASFHESRLGLPWDEARTWLEGWGKVDEGAPSARRL